jgi:hypothetical protein
VLSSYKVSINFLIGEALITLGILNEITNSITFWLNKNVQIAIAPKSHLIKIGVFTYNICKTCFYIAKAHECTQKFHWQSALGTTWYADLLKKYFLITAIHNHLF